MVSIKSLQEIPETVKKYRPQLNYCDKSLKVTSYLGLCMLECVGKGRVSQWAHIASKASSFRVLIWGTFAFQDVADLGEVIRKRLRNDATVTNTNKLDDLGTLVIVLFEGSYAGGKALSYIPFTRSLSSWVSAPAGALIIALDSVSIATVVQQIYSQKADARTFSRSDGLSIADDVCDIGSTVLELVDKEGLTSAVLGTASGLCNIASKLTASPKKPGDNTGS